MRAMPPGQPTAAAYVAIHNPADSAVVLIGGSTPAAAVVEIHESRQEDGMWRMRKLPGLQIPAGGRVTMAPGGVHLMLFDVDRPLKEGESIPLRLEFDTGETRDVLIDVRNIDAGAHRHHHH